MRNIAIAKHGRNFSTEVRNTNGRWLATLTRGAYTVVLAGPSRRFAEGKASVSHAKWVRTYPEPYAGEVDQDWLEQALGANKARVPDVLAIAMQYIRGARPSMRMACRLRAMPVTAPERRTSGKKGRTSTTISV